ncbi:hypothetical protein [Caballeronia sp. CLC5]|nr:hypothetical protein [Caballeronia sp. CLC5]
MAVIEHGIAAIQYAAACGRQVAFQGNRLGHTNFLFIMTYAIDRS